VGWDRLEGGALMPQQSSYLSTDPTAGEYLSTDPTAGEPVAPSATPPATPSSGIGGFFSEATKSINPVNINAAIQSMFWHPIDTAKGMLKAQDVPRHEAMTSFQQGDYVTGTRKLIDWLIPVLGPRLDEAADYMQQGQIGRGLGATADVGLTIATPELVRGVTKIPVTRAGVAETAGDIAERTTARIIAPQVGPQKIRFGTMAADVAPAIARRTTAVTPSGLLNEVSENAARANQALDAAYAASGATPVSTQPIIANLQRELQNLSVQGTTGAAFTPATRAARVASLKQALTEAQALGPTATLEQLRQLRIAWDDGAQAVFTPITADNFQTARAAGRGWADARTALNDVMIAQHPELAPLNADVHLWTKAQDVLQAAEEVERVRPTVGRSLIARGIGAGIGAHEGGGMGAALGAIIAPSVEAAIGQASPSAKLVMARQLARLSDALRRGQRGQIQAAVRNVSLTLPAAQRTAFMTQAVRIMRDLEPAAAQEEQPASSAEPKP
jgi:hypothetical protein